MNYHIIINKVSTVDELPESWSNQDLIALLDRFGFPDAAKSNPAELRELLTMAISDFEPSEAAAILLDYRLSDELNEGQIEQISHDMLLDKISEEYPVIGLHHQLFNINQLLHKAYNGKFPSAKATIAELNIRSEDSDAEAVTKEIVLKALQHTLNDSNLIKRLFTDHLLGKVKFEEADSIIWELSYLGENQYRLTTSEYWIARDEFLEAEFDAEIAVFEEAEEE
ncbi:hypothetical protein SYJ56_15915 [Algoriphagus sp. D3-2-R+10]|uniref:hypothetical protein n=1 Tax=Algoriphagus aurantiacus TaxID=3103948 RepID=UPI002B3EF10E|nr:hypothetical protein [Algoriphagus sp. D3-2-R+10]MEB2776813.1 hypothetical protein [Algoriphagus sp. D3-2-R+10]